MIYDGKTYRNLEGQVKYLTEVAEALDNRITEVAANIPSKMIVEELPEEGDPNITYYVGPKGTAPNYYYEVWVWVQEVEDGPFVWRELEDTDQVDLSGYLPKDETVTTNPQAYVKNADGTQGMLDCGTTATAGRIVQRSPNGQINLPDQTSYTPSTEQAVSKRYSDGHYIAKQTGVTSANQVYAKAADGSQTMQDISTTGSGAIIARQANGQIYVPSTPSVNNDATSKKYVDDTFLAKQTGATTYPQVYAKYADGSQNVFNVSAGANGYHVVQRTSGGQLVVPSTPTENTHAASKEYVDAAVGQLIYHHNMVINYTITGDTDYVKIAAHSDNNTSTAYTNIDWHNMPLVMPDYALYHKGSNDYLASVTKLPRSLHQDEFSEPRDGFLITYWNGNAFVNERVNNNIYDTVTVTDVVTTW